MRIFLDSNVIISAMIFKGNELELITYAKRNNIDLVMSEDVEEEVLGVVLRKFQ